MVDVAHFEAVLKSRLEELGHRLEDVEHQLDEPMPQDFEERASDREGDEVLEELGHAGEMEIKMILAALKRIQAGEYGICASCGEEIATQRLEVVPHAPLCQSCAAGKAA